MLIPVKLNNSSSIHTDAHKKSSVVSKFQKLSIRDALHVSLFSKYKLPKGVTTSIATCTCTFTV